MSLFLSGLILTPLSSYGRPSSIEVFQTDVSKDLIRPLVKKELQYFKRFRSPPPKDQLTFIVDENKTLQRLDGFGATLTESCAIDLGKLPSMTRQDVLQKIFSKVKGAGFDLLRLPMGATDFSDSVRGNYTYDDTPHNLADPTFRHLNFSRDEKTFSIIREARKINPHLQVMISPWSPPAWMKTPVDLLGGELNPSFAQDFARYFIHVIHGLTRRGVPVKSLTIQNEPGYANSFYPSMGMSADQQSDFIQNHLGPLFHQLHMRTKIFAHDHNWDMSQDTVIPLLKNPETRKYVSGVAYHCYGGNRWQMYDSMNAYPELPTIQDECSGSFSPDNIQDFHWWLQNQSLGAVNMGTTGAMGWNLCLDQDGGPRNNGCEGCRGIVTTDFSKKRAQIIYNPEFYALAQVSRFIRPGTRRLGMVNTTGGDVDNPQVIAFKNPDQSFVLVAENTLETPVVLHVQTSSGWVLEYPLPGLAAVSLRWWN